MCVKNVFLELIVTNTRYIYIYILIDRFFISRRVDDCWSLLDLARAENISVKFDY